MGHARAGGSHGLPWGHVNDIRAAMTVIRWLNYEGVLTALGVGSMIDIREK
jgi:hypothetical protein